MRLTLCLVAAMALAASAARGAAAEFPSTAPEPAVSQSVPPPAPAKRVSLRLAIPPADVTAVFMRAQRAVFDAYVRSHPEVELEKSGEMRLESAAGPTSSSLLAIAGGVSPDVITLYFQAMHSYIEQGFILPMDEYLDNWEGAKDVPSQLWPVATAADL